MVEEAKTVKKTVASKAAKSTVKPAEAAVWPFPEVEKAPKAAAKKPVAAKPAAKAVAEKKPAAKAVAEKKPAAAKAVAQKKPAAAKAAAKPAEKKTAQPSAQERYSMVETAAYYIAERSGFQGCTTDHWAAAEIEIAAKLAS
jgi:hypothetical protein